MMLRDVTFSKTSSSVSTPKYVCQGLNELALVDDNKKKIVEEGALKHYARLLRPETDEMVLRKATKGLWSLAFEYKNRISAEPGCRKGHCFFVFRLLKCSYWNRVNAIDFLTYKKLIIKAPVFCQASFAK